MRILAVGPHPDDIEWGMGGTLLKLASQGHQVCLVVLTRGEAGGDPDVRQDEMRAAAEQMAASINCGDYWRDTEVPYDKALIEYLELQVQDQVDELYLPWLEDTHQDHINTAKAGLAAGRYVKRVLYYETSTSLAFDPDVFVDITALTPAKAALLCCHASQLAKYTPTAHNIMTAMEATARYRGVQAGVDQAEGFKVHRFLRDV